MILIKRPKPSETPIPKMIAEMNGIISSSIVRAHEIPLSYCRTETAPEPLVPPPPLEIGVGVKDVEYGAVESAPLIVTTPSPSSRRILPSPPSPPNP